MKFRQSLFWDTDPSKIDTEKHAQYIVEKILDFGNDEEVKWLWNFYDKPFLASVVQKSRSLRPRTKKLWELTLQN